MGTEEAVKAVREWAVRVGWTQETSGDPFFAFDSEKIAENSRQMSGDPEDPGWMATEYPDLRLALIDIRHCLDCGDWYVWVDGDGTIWRSDPRFDGQTEISIEELGKLVDDVPPVSFDEIRPVIDADIGLQRFVRLDSEPLATASIAQIHGGGHVPPEVAVRNDAGEATVGVHHASESW